MACGRLIICTRGTYSGDFVQREGTGLAVDYSEAALREAIVSLRDNRELRENLGRNALRAALTRYNWPNEEKKLLEIYAGLQDRPKGR
jgi:glycosyltransferase involved in cell wall biosynthesis